MLIVVAFLDLKESVGVASSSSSVENDVRIKEWEVDMYQNEVAISQGIRIRRKPPSTAPLGYSGPFELRLHTADSSPTNILEEITWFKAQEVSRVRVFFFLFTITFWGFLLMAIVLFR